MNERRVIRRKAQMAHVRVVAGWGVARGTDRKVMPPRPSVVVELGQHSDDGPIPFLFSLTPADAQELGRSLIYEAESIQSGAAPPEGEH